jgi:uncharacterized protein (TIGR03435 family)
VPASLIAQAGSTALHIAESQVDAAPVPYQVHIVPTGLPEGSSSIETGSTSWIARGYDLRSLIALVYGVDGRRVDFANQGVATARFDLSATLPEDVDPLQMKSLLEDAIERRFGLEIAPQSRAMSVYVLTAPSGPGAAMKRHVTKMSAEEIAGIGGSDAEDGDSGKVTVFGQDCTDKGSTTGISVEASTMADFRRTLEPDLDRVLVDETHLTGTFDFAVNKYANQQELFQLLHDQLGLVVTPAERNVTVLAVRPASAKAESLRAQL